MDPALVLYALCGLVGLAIAIFVVGSLVSVLRRPQLPDLTSLELGQAALTIAPLAPLGPSPSMVARVAQDNSTFEIQATTPFQRAVRALTPVPWLPKLPPAPITPLAPAKPRIDIPELPRLAASTPVAPVRTVEERSVSVVAVPSLTPKPELVAKPGAAKPRAHRRTQQRARLPAPAMRFANWEARYPRKHGRGRRIVLVMLALLVACSGALVAAPHLIDPLCDDYEWFGDDAAQSVRQVAVDAHDTLARWL
jgi:hypothetical protein